MATPIRIKRGTRAQLDSAATAGDLIAGEPYLITDEPRIAVGLSATTYESFARESEAGGTSGGSSGGVPVGTVAMFGETRVPTGWIVLNGQEVSQATYPDLFAHYGSTFNTSLDQDSARSAASKEYPDMTGAVTGDWSVSASSEYSATYPAWKAFDGIGPPGFDGPVSSANTWNATTTAAQWLEIASSTSSHHLFKYRIYSRGQNFNAGSGNFPPRNWDVQGWDGAQWVVLDTRSDELAWGYADMREYTLPDASTIEVYSKFRLTTPSGESCNIAELELLTLSDLTPYQVSTQAGYFRVPDYSDFPVYNASPGLLNESLVFAVNALA